MNWKAFTIACASAFFISFPQNIIGCGPDVDPYDYYTSFFHPNLPDVSNYKPFYYTSYDFLYSTEEPVESSEVLTEEWVSYCGSSVKKEDVQRFVFQYNEKAAEQVYKRLASKSMTVLPDSLKNNSMVTSLVFTKNYEAVEYILFAKKVEPFVVGSADYWDAPKRDSIKMSNLIEEGKQQFSKTNQEFLKLKYGYQIVRLAHYSERYQEVINWLDTYVSNINAKSVVQQLSLSLKAGALFKMGQYKEAAYLFSQSFANTDAKRISNYLGFNWSINSDSSRNVYLDLCKTKEEKASMLSLFAMNGLESEINSLKEIYTLNPSCKPLEVLAVREINKLEEKYFTPLLQKEQGGKPFYYTWYDERNDTMEAKSVLQVKELSEFLFTASQNVSVNNRALFAVGAAYTAYMLKDYTNANKYIAYAIELSPSSKVKDQIALTTILISINETDHLSSQLEEKLLPSLQWIKEKAKNDKTKLGYAETNQWQLFYRNVLSEIIAQKYHQQKQAHKEILAIGNADKIYGSTNAVYYMRDNLSSEQVMTLYKMMNSKTNTAFEKYLIQNNSLTLSNVIDFIGTAYLRDNDYVNAKIWLTKSTSKDRLAKNPFVDLLYDQEEQLQTENKFFTTKLIFANEMNRLINLEKIKKATAKDIYKIANGLYNTTYYGHTWELVEYSRSGSDGYYIPKNATQFKKEYYGCFKAHDYFKKAMELSPDKNFKARCLFMMAKCKQKQVGRPNYSDYPYDNYDAYQAAEWEYFTQFKNNEYFPDLIKQYKNTAFYKEAYNSCSYLRDFINRK